MPDAPEADFSDIVEGVITTIPLDRLMLSTLNVRQTERAADVDSLAEDIFARGLKQNLVVVPAHFVTGEATEDQRTTMTTGPGGTGPWVNRFEVIAGGRRFQAMQLLVQQERLSSTFPVPCMIEFRDEAAETSLSENLHRVAMNPADEFEAFRVIVEQAKQQGTGEDPVAYCAKRFGVTVKHVQGRLRLASLAPEVLVALRNNEIGLESAKAYAGVEDHKLQLKVYKDQCKSNWKPHDPQAVRQGLRGQTLSPNDPLIKFISIEAYVEAGGRIEVEMFMGSEGQERIVDVKLVEQLAQAKAEPMVPPAAKADGFKSGLLAKGYGTGARWPKAPDGMEQLPFWAEKPTKAQQKKCVGVYAIGSGGTVIDNIGMFRPVQVKEPAKERDWEAERAERQRNWEIERRAAQLAVYQLGQFTGTPFEGHAFWPSYSALPVETDRLDEAFALVTLQVRLPRSDIEARLAEAERLIDEEAAATETPKAEAAAEPAPAELESEAESD